MNRLLFFHRPSPGRFWWTAAMLACLLGTQLFGYVHRVAHGHGLPPEAVSSTALSHSGHDCQLFDALTLGSCARGAVFLPHFDCIPESVPQFRSGWLLSCYRSPGFDSRAPPALTR